MKLLVTSNVFKGYENLFKDFNLDIAFKYEGITKKDACDTDILIGMVPVDTLDYFTKLKYLHLTWAGSYPYAKKLKGRDIVLTNSTGCFSLGIAEYILAMIMYFNKNIFKYVKNQEKNLYMDMGECKSIYGSNILVIGAGSIGMEFSKRANFMGAHVTGIKRTEGIKPSFLDNLYTMDKLDEIIGDFDIVVMSLPENESTRYIMNEDRLSKLKDGTILINVGRGSAIDTISLIHELEKGRIYAALDVYEKEPLSRDNPLWQMENCLILPHITGGENLPYTRDETRELAIYNLKMYLEGKELKNVVDMETGYRRTDNGN